METSGSGGDPRGLQVATTAGCVQCHNPTFNNGRGVMGAINPDFEWFKAIVYNHPAAYPPTRASLGEPPYERLAMGSFNPLACRNRCCRKCGRTLSTSDFATDAWAAERWIPSKDGVVYKLDVENTGLAGRGLTAEDVTVMLTVPPRRPWLRDRRAGYQGVRRDEQAKANVAVWTVSRMAPKDRQTTRLPVTGWNCQGQRARHHTLDEADGKDRRERCRGHSLAPLGAQSQ